MITCELDTGLHLHTPWFDIDYDVFMCNWNKHLLSGGAGSQDQHAEKRKLHFQKHNEVFHFISGKKKNENSHL